MSQKLPVSRWQRDPIDSTVLRNMGVALGYTVLAHGSLTTGMGKLEVHREALAADLNDSPEVLAEAVQTVMRRRHGLTNPYERLKEFTRGRAVTLAAMHEFIDSLAELARGRAQAPGSAMTPAASTGLAATASGGSMTRPAFTAQLAAAEARARAIAALRGPGPRTGAALGVGAATRAASSTSAPASSTPRAISYAGVRRRSPGWPTGPRSSSSASSRTSASWFEARSSSTPRRRRRLRPPRTTPARGSWERQRRRCVDAIALHGRGQPEPYMPCRPRAHRG